MLLVCEPGLSFIFNQNLVSRPLSLSFPFALSLLFLTLSPLTHSLPSYPSLTMSVTHSLTTSLSLCLKVFLPVSSPSTSALTQAKTMRESIIATTTSTTPTTSAFVQVSSQRVMVWMGGGGGAAATLMIDQQFLYRAGAGRRISRPLGCCFINELLLTI